jgi:hypothetical protein
MRNEKYSGKGLDPHSTYLGMKNKLLGALQGGERHAKVNLDVLKRMHYTDFNLGEDDDFKPTDIIDEDDDSEDSILDQFKAQPIPEISLSKENIIINKSEVNTYNEKVVNIKHQIKGNDKGGTPGGSRKDLIKLRANSKTHARGKDSTMIEKYRGGRNVSQVQSKTKLQQSYIGYPPSGIKMKNNNSVSKISQSMDINPAKGYSQHTLAIADRHHVLPYRGTTKAADNKNLRLDY